MGAKHDAEVFENGGAHGRRASDHEADVAAELLLQREKIYKLTIF
jgi:hypothetical protein